MWLVWVDEWTGWQVNELFVLCNRAPQCRDRRPRLSALLPLHGIPLSYIPSFGGAWGGSLFTVLWRTDEGVCPYFVVSSSIENTNPNWLPLGAPPLGGGWEGFPDEGVCPYIVGMLLFKEGVSSMWGDALFIARKRPRCIKETPSSMWRERSFNFKILLPVFL